MTYPSKDIGNRDFIALEGQHTKNKGIKVSMKKERKPCDISRVFILLLTR